MLKLKEESNSDKMKDNKLPIMELNDINKEYKLGGGYVFKALADINFSVKEGEVLTILGHNGAGKSTLIKIIMGFTKPTSGSIKIFGTDTSKILPKHVKAKIGYIPEVVHFYGNLSGIETMEFFGKLNNLYNKELFEDLLDKVGIAGAADKKVVSYSKGMKQRLAFAVSRIKDPDIYIFDEPTSGMDPSAVNDFISLVRIINDKGKTIIMTAHILPEIEDISNRICVILNGKITALGEIPELLAGLGLPTTINLKFKNGFKFEEGWFENIKNSELITDYKFNDKILSADIKFIETKRIKLINEIIGKYRDDLADMSIKKPGLFEIFSHFSNKKVSND